MSPLFPILIFFILPMYSLATYSDSGQRSRQGQEQWATSVDGLTFLAEQELDLYPHIRQFKESLELNLRHVTSWLKDYEEGTVVGTRHLTNQSEITQEVSSHPLMALRMIRRFVNLKKNFLENNGNETEPGHGPVFQHLTEIHRSNSLPRMSDYEDTMESIIHIRNVYDLSAYDLFQGNISGVQTNVGLTPNQVYEIARHAEKTRKFHDALEWLQPLILTSASGEEFNGTDDLQVDVDRIFNKHNESLHEMTVTVTDNDNAIQENYYKLCKGDTFMTAQAQSSLTCFYDCKSHPAWYVNPLKVEVHSHGHDPYLVRIYNAITEQEAEYLKNEREPTFITEASIPVYNPYFNRSDPNSVESLIQASRLASYKFPEENSKLLRDLEVKVGQMTGLKVQSYPEGSPDFASDRLLVSSYAFGGHFETHVDILADSYLSPLDGNRMATFLIYLNDVKLGGSTAFPKIGVSVQPIKKSAIFFYNFRRNGNVEDRSVHGGCPVIIGPKWVSNTWIRSFANFQTRRCSLNPDA